jgi:hypothetical protein
MPGHRGESFLDATIFDFTHGSFALPSTSAGVLNSVVNTIRTTGNSPEMLIQVEGFAYVNEGGIWMANSRALVIKNELIQLITAAGLSPNTRAGVSRFEPSLAKIKPGNSAPNTSDIGRIVKVYLFHKQHSAGI